MCIFIELSSTLGARIFRPAIQELSYKMHRILRLSLSVVFGLLCLAVAMSWVRSYVVFDRMAGPSERGKSLIFVTYEGRITAVKVNSRISREWPGWDHGPVRSSERKIEDIIWYSPSLLGFDWISDELYVNVPNSVPPNGYQPAGLTGPSWACRGTGLMFPHWFAALLLGLVSMLPWLKAPTSYQFSLRSLLIATTLISILLGLIVWDDQQRIPGHNSGNTIRIDKDRRAK